MARSSRIYVVVDNSDSEPISSVIAAFTVKHELVSWLSTYRIAPNFSDWAVVTTKDGCWQGLRDHVQVRGAGAFLND